MFSWIGGYIRASMQTAYALAYAVFVLPWLTLWDALKGPVITLFGWIGSYIRASMQTAYALAYAVFVLPFIAIWNNVLRGPVTAFGNFLQGIWQSIGRFFATYVTTPISNAWTSLIALLTKAAGTVSTSVSNAWKGITTFFNNNVVTPIRNAWTSLTEFLPKAMSNLGKNVQNIWTGVVNTIRGAMRNVLQFIANAINSVGAQINRLISAFNRLPGPDIPFVPKLSVPAFAEGGIVDRPTLALVGEGGEREFIIPESKMAAASANYLSGARGDSVIPSGNAQINVTTGPVMQQDGQQYVSMADLERAMRKTADGIYASLRTPSSRIALGRA
jgi:hypothetical protein